jgi:hypothetical protein
MVTVCFSVRTGHQPSPHLSLRVSLGPEYTYKHSFTVLTSTMKLEVACTTETSAIPPTFTHFRHTSTTNDSEMSNSRSIYLFITLKISSAQTWYHPFLISALDWYRYLIVYLIFPTAICEVSQNLLAPSCKCYVNISRILRRHSK